MPFEVVELFGQLVEILDKEHLAFGTRPVPEGDLPVAVLQTLELVKDVASHRRHTGTTTDKDHLFLRVAGEELTKRAGDGDLVTGFQVEDIRRHLARRNTGGARRRRGNTDVEHNEALFVRVVGHRIGPLDRFIDRRFILPQIELVPIGAVLFLDVEVLVRQLMRRGLDLDIATGAEVHILTLGQFQHQVFDEGCDVFIGAHGALPFFHAEHLFGHFDVHVLLDRDLTGQTVATRGFALGDVAFLGGQDRAATGMHTHAALRTGATPATGGGDEHFLGRQRLQQFAARRNRDGFFTVDGDVDVARADELGTRRQNDRHQCDNDQCEQENA